MTSRSRVEEIYRELVRASAESRADSLRRLEIEDRELWERVNERMAGPRTSVESPGATGDAEPVPSMVGRLLGPYRILGPLGRGGMGRVFLAERADGAFRGRVAVKLVEPGGGDDVVRRFRAERQTLADLDHPNIARLLDAGATLEGWPYLVMEHVDGVRIDDFCDANGLGVEARLELFLQVCDAVEHAHRHLVVHRDLKPENILVDSRGTVKLLDFGIAKLLAGAEDDGAAVLTRTGRAVMSVEYASPEQLSGGVVTTAIDVYALGLLLYRLLTGAHPYEVPTDALGEAYRVVCEVEPPRPSQAAIVAIGELSPARLAKRLEGDLDTIVLVALRKEPSRRYSSVARLADDVRRHLAGLTVRARPDTLAYRLRKLVGRHRVASISAGVVTVVLALATVTIVRHARVAEQRAEDVRSLAGALVFEVDDLIRDLPGSTPARQRIVTRALEYLDELAGESADEPELQRELAAAYLRVGNIQGNPNDSNLGDAEGALASYRKALALTEAVVRRAPEDPEARRSLALVFEKLADLRAWMGDLNEARDRAEAALGIFRGLAETRPADLRSRLSLAISLVKNGDLRGNPSFPNLGEPEAALDAYREASALLDELALDHPEAPRVRRYRGLIAERLGTLLRVTGDLEGSAEAYRASFEIRSEIASENPGNTDAQRELAVALEKLAETYLVAGNDERALEASRRSFEGFLALASADPRNVAARRSLAISHEKLADVLERLGREAEARRHLEASRDLRVDLVSAEPDNAVLQDGLEAVLERLEQSSDGG